MLQELKNKKANTHICSLSKRLNIGLMWSMCADGHKGCCIECSVTPATTWKKIKVDYSENAMLLNDENDADVNKILGVKSPQWQYEEDGRFIKEYSKKIDMKIRINRIYLGMNMSRKEVKFYK